MKSLTLSNTLATRYDADFKAEVIAAEIAETGFPLDRIIILMLGPLKRAFSKDIDAIDDETGDYDHKEYKVVKTPKEGIYDMLPEGLFHLPTPHRSAKTEKEIIDSIKKRREEERNARRFFLPFEAAMSHLTIEMALYENALDKKSYYDEQIKIFEPYWKVFQYLDNRQANIFIHILPIIHEVRDEHDVIETILELIFLLPVEITIRRQLSLVPDERILSELGNSSLGVDFTTGNNVYDDGDDEILIKIGPLSQEEFKQFMPGGSGSRILELLCDYLLPVNIDVITEIDLREQERIARLADREMEVNSVLGVDTFL